MSTEYLTEYLTVGDLVEQLQRFHPWELTDVTEVKWRTDPRSAIRVFAVPGYLTKEEIEALEERHKRILAEITDRQRYLNAIEARRSCLEVKIERLEKRLSTIGRLVAQRRPALP